MARIQDIDIPYLEFAEAAAPGTPAAAITRLYAKADGLLYSKDDAGAETVVSGGGGSAAEFATSTASVATGESTTSTTFADLATSGPSVTVTIGASGKAKVSVRCRIQNDTTLKYGVAGVVISGATTVAAATWLILTSPGANLFNEVGATKIVSGLNAGSTTFKMQYATQSNTSSFTNRELIVEPVL